MIAGNSVVVAAALILLFILSLLPAAHPQSAQTYAWVGNGLCTFPSNTHGQEGDLVPNSSGESCLKLCAHNSTCLGVSMYFLSSSECKFYTSDQMDGGDGNIDYKCFRKTSTANRCQMALLPLFIYPAAVLDAVQHPVTQPPFQ